MMTDRKVELEVNPWVRIIRLFPMEMDSRLLKNGKLIVKIMDSDC